MRSLAFYKDKLEREGLPLILSRRARWYWWVVAQPISRGRLRAAGWLVERLGDRARIDGLTFSTASPLIAQSQKGEMLLGAYEAAERRLLKRWVRPELPVIELGGAMGVVSCLTNRLLERPKDHVVVEANPLVIPLLERNRDLNECGFRVVNKALAYGADTATFVVSPRFTASRLESDWGTPVSVATTSFGATLAEAGFDQVSLVCDIEGAEAALVERELDLIRRRVRSLLIEIHPGIIGEESAARLIRTLEGAGFALRERSGATCVFTRD